MRMLRWAADDGAFEEMVAGPEDGAALDDHVAFQAAALAQHHVVFHDAEGPDGYIRSKLCSQTDDGRRVNSDHSTLPQASVSHDCQARDASAQPTVLRLVSRREY